MLDLYYDTLYLGCLVTPWAYPESQICAGVAVCTDAVVMQGLPRHPELGMILPDQMYLSTLACIVPKSYYVGR